MEARPIPPGKLLEKKIIDYFHVLIYFNNFERPFNFRTNLIILVDWVDSPPPSMEISSKFIEFLKIFPYLINFLNPKRLCLGTVPCLRAIAKA